jgi:RNA polymerase sigma factor (TIGR02999 family)
MTGHADHRGREAADPAELVTKVYNQLRAIARGLMSGERPSHTLQATALVGEAYLRLERDGMLRLEDRAAFYRAAAEAMRRILIEHARRRDAVKRGGGRKPVELSGVLDLAAADDGGTILSFDEALSRLDRESPDAASVVRLRFYAGLSVEQTAEALGVSARTVNREWRFARAWLYRALTEAWGRGRERRHEPG